MRPPDENAKTFSRDLRQMLRVEEVGLRLADNVCPIVTFEYSDARAPIDVAVPVTEVPLAVWCLDVCDTDRATPTRLSGRSIDWTWRAGAVRVHNVDIPTTANTYRVTIGILR